MNILCLSLIVTCRLFVIAGLYVLQRIGSTQEGNASFTLSGDYYNRELSGNNSYFMFKWFIVFDHEENSAPRLFRPIKT